MSADERDAQGIAVDEWCWTDMMREYVETQDRLAAAMDRIMEGK
jgi:hypothetical protein